MSGDTIFYAYAGSLILSAVLIVISLRIKTLGRILFSLIFLWAGFYNLRTAFIRPEEYLGFAHFAYSELVSKLHYRIFFTSYYNYYCIHCHRTNCYRHTHCVARTSRYPGISRCVIFLVAIAPLGIGSAFPSTILMAIAAILLLRNDYPRNLAEHVFMFFRDKL